MQPPLTTIMDPQYKFVARELPAELRCDDIHCFGAIMLWVTIGMVATLAVGIFGMWSYNRIRVIRALKADMDAQRAGSRV